MLPLLFVAIPMLTVSFLHWLWRLTFTKTQSVKDKVVMVTGASSGLGEACAKKFASEGAKVVLCARNLKALERVKSEISDGEWPVVKQLDMTCADDIRNCVAEIETSYGRVDVLLSNAGVSQRGSVIDSTIDVHTNLMAVNYFGPVNLVKAVLPGMVARQSGHIISVGSVQSRIAIPFRSAYAASKHASQAFFDTLRAEVAKDNVNVSVVNPGYISTNLSLNALSPDGSKHGVLDATTASGMDPSVVAQLIYDGYRYKQDELTLCDLKSNLGIFIRTLSPALYHTIMRRRAKSEAKKMA